jgi:O-antigen/teichoic acid export membrane protein
METEHIRNRTIRSIIALTGRTVFLQLVAFGAFFLLGIFLPPSALGVFIAVSALMRIFNFFTDLGFGAALIQKKEELEEADLRTAFTLQEIAVVLAMALGLVVTPLVKSYLALDSQGVFLYYVLLFSLFLSSLKTIPSILLERHLDFERQIIPQIAEAIVFNLLVVILAYKGFGVAAYSWSILLSALVGLPIYYLISPWKIGLGIAVNRARQLFSYGFLFQSKSILAVIKDDLLTLFLGGLVGTTGIGYWGWAQRWAYSPFRLIVDSTTKVTFPTYSRLQHDAEALRKGIEKSLFAIAIILFPVLTVASVLMSRLVTIIPKYSKWEPALPSFYFLCATAAISGMSSILVNALDATGRVKVTLGLMVLWIISTWIFTIYLVGRFGFTGIAMASFIVSLTLIVTIILVKQVVNFSFFRQVFPAAVGSLGAGVTTYYLARADLLSIIVAGSFGMMVYAGIVILLARNELTKNFRLILKAYKKEE